MWAGSLFEADHSGHQLREVVLGRSACRDMEKQGKVAPAVYINVMLPSMTKQPDFSCYTTILGCDARLLLDSQQPTGGAPTIRDGRGGEPPVVLPSPRVAAVDVRRPQVVSRSMSSTSSARWKQHHRRSCRFRPLHREYVIPTLALYAPMGLP